MNTTKLLILLLATALPTAAQEHTAASFTSDVFVHTNSNNLVSASDGFEFIPVVDIEVTALGYYDHQGNGLIRSHPVGIFDTATQARLTVATIDNADALEPASHFRYEALATPIRLVAGQSYCVAGFDPGATFDPYIHPSGAAGGEVSIEPLLDFVSYRTAGSQELVFPKNLSASGKPRVAWYGPNLKFKPVSTTPYYGIVEKHSTPAPAARFSLPQTPVDDTGVPGPDGGFAGDTSGPGIIPKTDLWVSHLGYYDHGGDGLNASYPIGIYETRSERLLASVDLSSLDPLDPQTHFRYQALPEPVKLSAGTSYSIVRYTDWPLLDEVIENPAGGLTLDPNFFLASLKGVWSDRLVYPVYEMPDRAPEKLWFGVNFLFTTGRDVRIDHLDRSADTLTIGWQSNPSDTYTIQTSPDLSTWTDEQTDYPSGGAHTTFDLPLTDPHARQLFIRIKHP